MIIKKFEGLDTEVHYEKLDNGLEIYLIPYKNRNNYYMEYGVKFGAKTCEFVSSKTNKKTRVPRGVAHFLEHKMFEQEDGIDPFSYFSTSGCDANALTNYDVTSYTVQGTQNAEENLDFLLSYVNSPYFTDENVEKEKGIIIEELNMYKDQPENKLYEESSRAFFVKHPMRYDIGGTSNSVRKITKEILYDCYDTFYQPNNMYLVVCGNIDCEKLEKVIKNNKKLNSKKDNKPIKTYDVKEPILVNVKEKEIKVPNLILPKSILSIKSPFKKLNAKDMYKYVLLLYILFGMSSSFREKIYNKKLSSLFYSSSSIIDNVTVYEFLAETEHPYELKDMVIDCLRNGKITKEDVERIKKVKISLEVLNSDSPGKTVNSIIKDITDYGEVLYNKMSLIREITIKDIEKVRQDIMIDNYSFIVGYPK